MTTEKRFDKLTFCFPEMDGENRLKELILYIADKCFEDPTFGAIKLNKILFFGDFMLYLRSGKPITGVEYQRIPNGPAPRRLLPIRKKMIKDDELVLKERDSIPYIRHQAIARRSANIDIFSAQEISLIDSLIRHFWAMPADRISMESHGIFWEIAGNKERIPYQAAFLSEPTITRADIERSHELVKEHGWDV